MGYFDTTKAAMARGEKVGAAILFKFDFGIATKRFWTGYGPLSAGGASWEGSGDVIRASGLEHPIGGTAPQATFSLSGVNADLVTYAANNSAYVTGRPCSVFLQFMRGERDPMDQPLALWTGTMDVMSFSGSGPQQRKISLTAETVFFRRIRSPYGYQTDRDQQARYPGDTGYQFVAVLKNHTTKWMR